MEGKLKSGLVLALLSILIGLAGCTSDESIPIAEPPLVTVSILPQHYFVTRIAQQTVNINVMIPPGHNPHTYEPTPQQMKALAKSKMYFRIGHIPFEKAWMKNISGANPGMVVIDTSVGVPLIEESRQQSPEHQHDEGHHHHEGVDPHIWLSPSAVKIQLKHILEGLCKIHPENRDTYQHNLDTLVTEINLLDNSTREQLSTITSRKILAYHPAWGYLAREYHLTQIAIESEGKAPNPAQLKELIQTARRENIRVILVQKQFDLHNAETIAREIKGRVIALDPLARDWLQNMRTISRTLINSLKNE